MDLSLPGEPYVFAAVFLVWIALSFVSTERFLFLTGMLVPLMTPRLDVGVGLDWSKILGPLALGLLLLRKRRVGTPVPGGLGWFIMYAAVVTAAWMVLEYAVLRRYVGAQAMGLGTMQSYYKMPVQLVSFIGQALTFYIVPLRATNRSEAVAAIRGVTAGVLLSLAFGILLYAATGQGMFGKSGVGYLEIEGMGIARIGGLSGEPKFLGIVLAILACWELSGLVFGRVRPLVFGAALVGLALTLSTSAWAGFVVGTLVLLAVSARYPLRARWRAWTLVGAAVLTVSLGASVAAAVLAERFSGRLFGERSEVARQKDALLVQAFEETPLHLLWGFGLGGGDLAVIPFVPAEELIYQRTPTPGVTGARIVGDLGLIGVAILVAVALRWARHLIGRGDIRAGAFALGGLAATFFGSLLALSAYFLIMGAALAADRLGGASMGSAVGEEHRDRATLRGRAR